MTDAPERIWAWFFMEKKQDDFIKGGWTNIPDRRETEYLRADLAKPKVKPLVWVKSNIDPWDGDWHTVPTLATIRGLGNEDYRLSYPGGFSVHNSPGDAKAAAQSDYERRILEALE